MSSGNSAGTTPLVVANPTNLGTEGRNINISNKHRKLYKKKKYNI